jgi:hypothetical protein
MAAKAEISWKRTSEEGVRLQVYAHHFGGEWHFYIRQKRYDNWQPVKNPCLEDWLALLDAIRRRVARRRSRPEEVDRVTKRIRELFPDEDVS